MEQAKKLLSGAVRRVVSCGARLGRDAVQLATGIAGSITRFVGRKTADLAKAHRQPLLLAVAVGSAVLAAVSVLLWLLGRKK